MSGMLDRGETTTRIEAFVDGAFAFALTLLVIAGDHIPISIAELMEALKGLPAYALSFALVVKICGGHAEWSRAFGLDDIATRRLSLLLVLLVLVFVYPLRMMFAALFASLSGGWLPAGFTVSSFAEIPVLFVTFGAAFGSLGAVLFLLYLHACNQRDILDLDAAERIDCRARMTNWGLIPLVALVSIGAALLIAARKGSGWWIGFPGFLYFSLNIATPMIMRRACRQQAELSST